MVGWEPSKQIKMLIVWLPTITYLESRNQVKLFLNTSKESGWIHMSMWVFSVTFFLHTKIGSVLFQIMKVCNSVKWIILLPDRLNKNSICPHSFISQDGYHNALILHYCILYIVLYSATLLLPGILYRLLRIAQNWMWELLFAIFLGRKTKFKHVAAQRIGRQIHTRDQSSLLLSSRNWCKGKSMKTRHRLENLWLGMCLSL